MSSVLTLTKEELRTKFYSLQNAQDVANLLEVDKKHLNYHLYISPLASRYTRFTIPKKSGGEREIFAPITSIKIIQSKLNQVLQAVYRPGRSVHSFIKDESIIKNASPHCKKEWVLNIDLENFFPTITFPRIRGMFMSKPFNIKADAATVLAQICCFEGKLPQGAPTSPIISNLICAKLDNELFRLTKKYDCILTRYADDITISTNQHDFPISLAEVNLTKEVSIGKELKEIIEQNWFKINNKKVHLRRRNLSQEVTGLIVNQKPNVKRRFVKQIRGMLHSWEISGLNTAQTEFFKRHYKKKLSPYAGIPKFEHILSGKLAFLGMVKKKDDPTYLRYYNQFKRLLLLEYYKQIESNTDHTSRGLQLEKFMDRLFLYAGIESTGSFRRNSGGEQIDGGFKIDGWQCLLECKWVKHKPDMQTVSGFLVKVQTSGKSTKGLFVSIEGWSDNVPGLLKLNQEKSVILMDGKDIKSVLYNRLDFAKFIRAKYDHLSYKTEPFYGESEYIKDLQNIKS